MRFSGKTAIITGGGHGIGRAVALRLAGEGAVIAIHDTNTDQAADVAKEIKDRGGLALVEHVDVSDPSEVRDALGATIEQAGNVGVLVCNAGINDYRGVFDYEDEDWQRILGVNLTGVWNYCRYVGEHMAQHGGGAIVNISSTGAHTAAYMRAPYMASKGGVRALTRALALDLADQGIRVNDVAPGNTETGMTRPDLKRPGYASRAMVALTHPLHRYGQPEEIAAAVAFLASDEASFITGASLLVDGGYTAGTPLGLPIQPIPEDDAVLSWLT